jgi:hypothetical protein
MVPLDPVRQSHASSAHSSPLCDVRAGDAGHGEENPTADVFNYDRRAAAHRRTSRLALKSSMTAALPLAPDLLAAF